MNDDRKLTIRIEVSDFETDISIERIFQDESMSIIEFFRSTIERAARAAGYAVSLDSDP